MRKNNKGFTLVELLASLVILGLIMAVAVPNVLGILTSNRNTTYVEDAKKLSTSMEYRFRGDNSLIKPAVADECIVATLAYLGTTEFEDPPYGGEYDVDKSFVVMKKVCTGSDCSYQYYVQLIEKYKNTHYRGVELTNTENLYNDNYADYVKNVTSPAYDFTAVSCGTVAKEYTTE